MKIINAKSKPDKSKVIDIMADCLGRAVDNIMDKIYDKNEFDGITLTKADYQKALEIAMRRRNSNPSYQINSNNGIPSISPWTKEKITEAIYTLNGGKECKIKFDNTKLGFLTRGICDFSNQLEQGVFWVSNDKSDILAVDCAITDMMPSYATDLLNSLQKGTDFKFTLLKDYRYIEVTIK